MNAWLKDGTLEESLDFLKGVVDSGTEALLCTNTAGTILWANWQAEYMLGADPGRLETESLDRYIESQDRALYRRLMEELVDDASGSRALRLKSVDRQGKEFFAEFRMTVFAYESVPVLVHTLRKIDEEVRDKQPAEVHPAVLQYGDHAFEALLNNLRGCLPRQVEDIVALSYRALRKYEQGLVQEGSANRQNLGQVARELARLLEDLGFNESLIPDPAPLERVSLDYVVSRALSEFGDVLDLPQNRVSRGYLPQVKGAPEHLYRLFRHLIGNAVKFRKKHLPLLISIDSFQGGNGVWHVLVKDNGRGFDNRDADRIFQPFVQLEEEETRVGAGLGLTICRRIVQGLGGKISALSEKGEGTTVIITFPGTDDGSAQPASRDQ